MNFEPLTLPTKRLVRLGIQGVSGTGKTVSACRFPNPHFIAMENTLPDLVETLPALGIDVSKIKIFPFYKPEYTIEYLKEKKAKVTHTLESKILLVRDAVKWFVKEDIHKYSNPEMTWVLDSWTKLQDFFDAATWDEKWYTADGKENAFAPWDFKIDYSKEVLGNLTNLDANVVVIFHEHQERDKISGQLTSKTAPVMQGKFIAHIKRHFPNYFRSVVKARIGPDGKEIYNAKTKKVEVEYLWQVGSDSEFDAKCSKPGLPTYVEADYKSIASV